MESEWQGKLNKDPKHGWKNWDLLTSAQGKNIPLQQKMHFSRDVHCCITLQTKFYWTCNVFKTLVFDLKCIRYVVQI